MLCQDCPKKETCTELCEEAEAYVNQDYIPPEDCQFCPNRDYCSVDFMEGGLCPMKGFYDSDLINPEEIEENITKSNEEIIIELFFIERKRVTQIARMISVSQPYVTKVVKKYKEILRENLLK